MLTKKEIRDTVTDPVLVYSLTDYRPIPRYDGTAWASATVQGAPVQIGPWSDVQSITFDNPDADPAQPATRDFTIGGVSPSQNYLRVIFKDSDNGEQISDTISVTPVVGNLTNVRNVRLRVGRELTDDENAQVAYLINLATYSIFATLGQHCYWQPPPEALGFMQLMATELVSRSMVNPHGLMDKQERIGQYQIRETYAIRGLPPAGLLLLPPEELILRRVVYGNNSGSVKIRSLADEYADLIWAEFETEWALWYGPSNPSMWAGGSAWSQW